MWPPRVNCVGDCTRKAAVSGAPGGGRHAEGTHCADTAINCWPYFLRTLEAGACAPGRWLESGPCPQNPPALLCGAWLAVCYVQLLLAAWREAFKLLGICSRPTSPLPPGQGAGDGGKLWSGCLGPEFISPLGHALGRARGGEETGWGRPLLGLDRPVDQSFPYPGTGFSLLHDRTNHLWIPTRSRRVVDQPALKGLRPTELLLRGAATLPASSPLQAAEGAGD